MHLTAGSNNWSSQLKLNTAVFSVEGQFMCETCQCIRLEPGESPKYMCQKAKCINPIQKRPMHINPRYFISLIQFCHRLEKGRVASYLTPHIFSNSTFNTTYQATSLLFCPLHNHDYLPRRVHLSTLLNSARPSNLRSTSHYHHYQGIEGPRNEKHHSSYRASAAWQEKRWWIYQTRRRG